MKKLTTLFLALVISFTFLMSARAEFFSDVIVTSPHGIWTDSRAYANLPAAINAVGALQRTIVIASQQSVGNITIPANVTLKFERDGAIIHSGQLTFNTKNILAENRQLFAGAGDIDFASGTEVKSGWFSTFERALSVTSDDTVTLLVTKAQTLTTSAASGNNVILKWESPGNILTANAGVTVSNIGQIEAGNYQILAGAGEFDFLAGTTLKSSWFVRLRSAFTWIGTSAKLTLLMDKSETTTQNEDWSAYTNVTFKIVPGAVISHGAFTIKMPCPDVGLYQIFSGTGAVTLSGEVKEIHPAWWGAVSGTDNTTAIQSAVNSVDGTSVVKVVIPKSKLSKEILIKTSNLYITSNLEEISWDEATYTKTVHSGSDTQMMFTISDVDTATYANNVVFDKIKLNMHWEGALLGNTSGIRFYSGSKRGVVRNSIFVDAPYSLGANRLYASIVFGSGARYCRAEGNIFYSDDDTYGGGGAVVSTAYGSIISNNTTIDCKDASFSTDDSFGDIITGNRIFNYSITGGLRRIVGAMIQAAHGTKNFQITNNFLYGVSAVGIYSYVYAGGVPIVGDVKNGIISNNILDFGGDLADGLVGTAGGGIFMSADVENVSISNNRIYNLPATPSNMAGITCTNRNIRVTDNYIDSGVTNANTSSIYIIVVDSTVKTEVVIKGNKVINRVNGIYVSGGGINNLGHPIILDGNTIDFGIGYAVDNTTNAPVNMPAIISESNYLPGAGGGFSSTLPLKRSGAATPVGAVLPQYIGEEYFNTTNSVWYKAKGTANTGWVPVSHVGGAAATVADGGTITHGFGSAPTWVLVTSSVSAEFVSVTAIAATTFTVAIKKHDGSAGTTQTIYWQAGL